MVVGPCLTTFQPLTGFVNVLNPFYMVIGRMSKELLAVPEFVPTDYRCNYERKVDVWISDINEFGEVSGRKLPILDNMTWHYKLS